MTAMNDGETVAAISHRRVRVAAIVAAGVAIGLIFWTSGGEDEQLVAVTVPTAASQVFALPTPSDATRMPATSPNVETSDGGSSRQGEGETCGVGRVADDRIAELEAVQSARLEAMMARLIDSLGSDADDRKRVAGLYLRSALDVGTAGAADARAATARCGTDRGCLEADAKAQVSAVERAGAPGAESIARLAARSSDPFTYGVALQACDQYGAAAEAAPSCRLLSGAQWARIDPGNATAWLRVAAEASVRKDGAALDEAMYRVGSSTGSKVYGNELFGHAMARVPDSASGAEQVDAFVFVIGVVAAWQLPAYQTTTQYCAAPLLQDSNRWQICDAVARHFVERGSTLIERRIGLRLGDRLKWSAEKMAALRQEDDAFARVQTESSSDPEPVSCRAIERARGFWTQVARLGEVGATRALVAASGKSVAALAAETRAERESQALAAAAEAAARPASAASGA